MRRRLLVPGFFRQPWMQIPTFPKCFQHEGPSIECAKVTGKIAHHGGKVHKDRRVGAEIMGRKKIHWRGTFGKIANVCRAKTDDFRVTHQEIENCRKAYRS